MHAFANPLPKPAALNHIDVYPFFDVWGWSVAFATTRGPLSAEEVALGGGKSATVIWRRIPGASPVQSSIAAFPCTNFTSAAAPEIVPPMSSRQRKLRGKMS